MPPRVIVDNSRYSSSTGSFIAEAAGNYADNDVVSDDAGAGLGAPITFADAVLATGGAAKIVHATLTFTAATAIAATSELELFSQAPTATELDDNAAAGTVAAADLPFFLGSIDFSAGTDIGAATLCLPTTLTPAVPLFIHAVAKSIFGRLIFRDAEINETAAMPVDIVLYLEN
jgi:hypothetical protein